MRQSYVFYFYSFESEFLFPGWSLNNNYFFAMRICKKLSSFAVKWWSSINFCSEEWIRLWNNIPSVDWSFVFDTPYPDCTITAGRCLKIFIYLIINQRLLGLLNQQIHTINSSFGSSDNPNIGASCPVSSKLTDVFIFETWIRISLEAYC